MTLLINLAALSVIATPGVVAYLGWRRWASPSASYRRDVMKMERRIRHAVQEGDFSRAHNLSYSLTGLRRHLDPTAEEYRIPELKGLYEHMEGED